MLTLLCVLTVAAVLSLGVLGKRRAETHNTVEGWGLGGRSFGTLITWFLVGGDFYTAYTLVAVPALVFATGGFGFFALPYTTLVYPFVFLTMPRFYTICREHGLLTLADFIEHRYRSARLADALALSGALATLPYITLQMSGIQTVAKTLLPQAGAAAASLTLLAIATLIAWYVYAFGLHAPARIAVAKDILIYMVVIAAVVAVPRMYGGYAHIFAVAERAYAQRGTIAALVPASTQHLAYASLALGSALAAFMYPHTLTAILASRSADAIRRNCFLLPAYTVLLGLLALLGIAGVAAGVPAASGKQIVPVLLQRLFPPWFAGISLAAIVVAALVPAAVMAISAGNLLSNRLQGKRDAQLTLARRLSVVLIYLAVVLGVILPAQFAVNLQLLGGVVILQHLPALCCGLLHRRPSAASLLTGWAAGIGTGAILCASQGFNANLWTLHLSGHGISAYIGLWALLANGALLCLVLTFQAATGWRTASADLRGGSV